MEPQAFFLPVHSAGSTYGGQRFCIFYPAHGKEMRGRGLVLYIHPFAEEMNKSRRMAALQARALAKAGYSVLQIDLMGCGDSSGDFGDATWDSWIEDVVLGCNWLCGRNNPQNGRAAIAPLWLWGLRAGCLLAVDAAKKLSMPCNFLFWQPPSAGKPLLQQFLRLKVAGDMLGGQSKGVMESVRQQLATSKSVEIAGYMLSSSLASGLERAVLLPPDNVGDGQQVEWFEVSTREEVSLSPISQNTVAKWRQRGFGTNSRAVNGPAFWQTSEIEDAQALIVATTIALSAGRG